MAEVDTALADALNRAGLTLAEVCKRPKRAPRPNVPRERPPVDVGLSAVRAQTRADLAMTWSASAADLDTAADRLAAARMAEPTKALLATFDRGVMSYASAKTLQSLGKNADKLGLGKVRAGWPPLVSGDAEADAEGFRAMREAATPPITFDYLEGPTGARIPVYVGNVTTVLVPGASGLERLPARYCLIPLTAIVPSNDPHTFAPTPGYPAQLQERDYARDKNEQAKVTRNAARFEASLVLNSNPDAINGPPIIDADGYVLGGNSRTMSILLHAEGNPQGWADALRAALAGHCGVFGVPEVPDPQNWILVRVLMGDYDEAAISRLLNRAFTGSMGEAATQASTGRLLPSALLEQLGPLLEENSLEAVLSAYGRGIADELFTSGYWLQTDASAMVRPDGQLTPTARRMLEGAIMGAAVRDRETLAALVPSLRDVVGRIAPVIVALDADPAAVTSGAAIGDEIRAAIGFANRLAQLDTRDRESAILTVEMFADPVREAALSSGHNAAMVWWLLRAARAPAVAARRAFAYLRAVRADLNSAAQPMLGGLDLARRSVEDLRAEVLDLPMPYVYANRRPDEWLAEMLRYGDAPLRPMRAQNPAVLMTIVNLAQAVTALAWFARSVDVLTGGPNE